MRAVTSHKGILAKTVPHEEEILDFYNRAIDSAITINKIIYKL